MSILSRLSAYRELSKSGIVALVLISVLGGYLCGQPSELPFSWARMLLTLLGVLCLASGSSAINQLQEVRLDSSMPRTAKRPLPSGRMSIVHAMAFIFLTVGGGLFVLSRVSAKVAMLGCLALLSYNVLYTLWWKRKWSYAAVPGAIPGALPILMGYAAASGQIFTPAGIYLFGLLFFWQMPHFWVLAIRFQEDYRKGGIPTLPVTHGSGRTVYQIVLWSLAYVGLATLAPIFLHVGALYCVPAFLMSLKVLWELRAFARAPESKKWLHFFLWINLSLIVYLALAAADIWSLYWVKLWTR